MFDVYSCNSKTLESASKRLFARTNKTDSCWLWTGPLTERGYGVLNVGGNSIHVHTVSYLLLVGDILEGYYIKRKCSVSNCVRPSHLYLASHDEVERFWSFVDRGKEDECWNWGGSKDKDGYGLFSSSTTYTVRAHRRAYEIVKGPLKYWALHIPECTNPSCCNPAHIYDGTPTQNASDRDLVGNTQRGETHYNHKVTKDTVLEIRRLASAGISYKDLERQFVISDSQVANIVNRISWGEVE